MILFFNYFYIIILYSMKNILIVDDDVDTSLRYKKWLEDEGFNLTLINNPELAEQNFKPEDHDLVLIGFRMSLMDGFDLYHKLYDISKKVEGTSQSKKEFRVCFMTSSIINYKVLAEIHPEFGEECYVCKKVQKDIFIKHVYSLIP
jgi:CheY-like chemotaxis protein